MFIISLIIILFTIIYLFVSYNNKANYIFALLFLDISALLASSAIYVSKVSNYVYSTVLDYRIYMLLSRLPLSFYDIANIYMMCLALMLLCFLAFFKLFSPKVGYVLLAALLVPIAVFYAINHSSVSWELYRLSSMSGEFNSPAGFVVRFAPIYSTAVILIYMILPLAALIREYIRTGLKFKRTYYRVVMTAIAITAIGAYYCAFGIFGGFVGVNNIDATRFPKTPNISGSYTMCAFLAAVMIACMVFTAVRKPFDKIYVFRNIRRRVEKISLGKNFSMVLHKYKNAFYSIEHTMEILQNSFDNADREGFEECLSLVTSISQAQIADLSAMARSCGEINLSMKDIDIADVLAASVESVRSNPDIVLTLRCDALNHRVFGDAKYLEEVFINIVNNAICAMKKKSSGEKKRLDINMINDDEYIVIKFRDNGIGIAKSQLKNVFKPFYTTGVPESNTGVGLKIVDDIVDKHNGYVYVDSEQGEWTEFSVILPVYEKSHRRVKHAK